MEHPQLGPIGGRGGKPFDGYSIPQGARLTAIHIYADWVIDALQFDYTQVDGKAAGRPPVGGLGGRHYVFYLDPDEYLTGISGRCGWYLDSIRFHTSKRESDLCGDAEAEWDRRGRAALHLPYYGFSHVDLLTGHGDDSGAAHLRDQRASLGDPERLRGSDHQLPHDYTCPQAIRTAIPEDQHSTFWVRDRALDYLSDPARQETPFFAFVSFPDPHHPFSPPGRYWDMYDPVDMVLPESFHARSSLPPPHLKWLRENAEIGKAAYGAALVNERQAREAIALTCGMIAMVDDAIGALLDQLDRAGLAGNTVVVFTSDHGDFLGDHGMILKGPMHYQSTIRVPFLWSDPAAAGPQRISRLASSVDIARTILDRAGCRAYWGMQGQNLFTAPARDAVLVEDEGNRISLGFATPPRVRTLVSKDFRLSIYLDQAWGELYDLRSDPGEIVNLWDSPAHAAVKAGLMADLVQELTRACDSSPWPDALA